MPLTAHRVRRHATSSPGIGSLACAGNQHKISHLDVDNYLNALTCGHLEGAAQKFTPCTEVRTVAHRSSHLALHRSSRFARLSTTKTRTLRLFPHRSSHFASHNSLIYISFLTAEMLAGLLKGLLQHQHLSFAEHGVHRRRGDHDKQPSISHKRADKMARFRYCLLSRCDLLCKLAGMNGVHQAQGANFCAQAAGAAWCKTRLTGIGGYGQRSRPASAQNLAPLRALPAR